MPAKFTLQKQHRSAQYFKEKLGHSVDLDMVLIPGGQFLMGSPENEPERSEREGPQHRVTVFPFFMGRYPITQAQWQAVANYPQVNRELDLNPSRLKGKDRPVEQISWRDATEFCQRLSRQTERTYRLPTEAEWEYACRAGTTTPFHFGETITTDLANYDGTDASSGSWSGSYGRGPKGIYRQSTTSVGSFPANAFGLHDMHGNVWEWCLDHWHSNYEGAPSNGAAWLSDDENAFRVRRGGSWYSPPWDCRSACRISYYLVNRDNDIGFRVVCVPPRTP